MAKHGIRNNKAPGAYRPIYKEGNQSKYCNYSGTNLVYVGSKLLIIMMHLGLRGRRYSLQKNSFGLGIGRVYQIFILRLLIEKLLSHKTDDI